MLRLVLSPDEYARLEQTRRTQPQLAERVTMSYSMRRAGVSPTLLGV